MRNESSSVANAAQQAVYAAIAAIPRGSVSSYGRIAERAGLPRRARLVGRLLANAPRGLKLPWHRVLRSDGRIAFAKGSAEFAEQVRRLAREGVDARGGRVRLPRMPAVADLDALLWAPPTLSIKPRRRK